MPNKKISTLFTFSLMSNGQKIGSGQRSDYWYVPADSPPDTIDLINKSIGLVLDHPDIRAKNVSNLMVMAEDIKIFDA